MAGSQNGKILISKMAKNGVTAAFVLDEVKISFESDGILKILFCGKKFQDSCMQ